ncbi:hypothetical protein BDN71DRAFT_1497692 [Pleurotus eryngii]|uniref:Uncharacterized protein n=1 Tax=Pleurotus eryngii TaxID=5323 RepID=A0A9P6D5R4_PLEER|nr:hypothetical protein BDN71DRAFT_1497692 [Pleurotus eryngii]
MSATETHPNNLGTVHQQSDVAEAEITEDGLCPLASSSPHHLFMGTYRGVLHPASDMRDVDAEWVKFAGDLVPLAEAELLQAKEQEREAEEFLLMEEELVRSGFLVYERDSGSDSPKYDSDDSDNWSDGEDYVSRREQNLSWAYAFDESPRVSKVLLYHHQSQLSHYTFDLQLSMHADYERVFSQWQKTRVRIDSRWSQVKWMKM